mmetsp:Transcript_4391/g.8392  ORF Transcript_4391/g.8392 Transcript_4391/m.8392 type:complete len:253 (-) Transcript_4391:1037-1795(-)
MGLPLLPPDGLPLHVLHHHPLLFLPSPLELELLYQVFLVVVPLKGLDKRPELDKQRFESLIGKILKIVDVDGVDLCERGAQNAVGVEAVVLLAEEVAAAQVPGLEEFLPHDPAEVDLLEDPAFAVPYYEQVRVLVSLLDDDLVPSISFLDELLRQLLACHTWKRVKVPYRLEEGDLCGGLALVDVAEDAKVVSAADYQKVRVSHASHCGGTGLASEERSLPKATPHVVGAGLELDAHMSDKHVNLAVQDDIE